MEPEEKLFLAIIIQLLEDYIADRPVADNKEEHTRIKLEARAWFRGNSEDYKTICDFAGVKYNILRKIVLNAKAPYNEIKELINEYKQLMRPSTL